MVRSLLCLEERWGRGTQPSFLMQSPQVKNIKIQTGDLEDSHKGIESSKTHLQPGLQNSDTARGQGRGQPRSKAASPGSAAPISPGSAPFSPRNWSYEYNQIDLFLLRLIYTLITIKYFHCSKRFRRLSFSKYLFYTSHPSQGEKPGANKLATSRSSIWK